MTNALIQEKLTPATISSENAKKVASARSGANSSGMSSRSVQKGGVIKTVVLPHEDFNKLAVEGQMLAAFLKK